MPEKLYILGHPVAHSKSPAMHNAAYEALGLKWAYSFMDCADEISARTFLTTCNWRACNITMPWKPLAFEMADICSDEARLAQGANVLVNWAGRLHADNTDGKGCVAYLRRCGISLEGVQVSVCGTGPTSLAIMHACARAGATRMLLLGRDETKAQGVLARYIGQARELYGDVRFEACAYDTEQGKSGLADSALIVDATPLGMNGGDPAPFDTSLLSEGQAVLDVVYGHGETRLLADARAAGCVAYDGAGMLVAQAVETVRDIANVTDAFSVPSHMDLFSIMANAAGLDC